MNPENGSRTMVTAQGNTFNQLDTETGKYRKT